MNDEQYCCELPNEFQVQIERIIKQEVNSRCVDIISELECKASKITELELSLTILKEKNKELEKTLKQINEFKIFKDLIDISNFPSFIELLKLKCNDFKISGMDSEKIPQWFKLLFRYYEDKERLFTLMDIFNIEYPNWAKDYKMPYDYNKEELAIFINPKYDRYITNGCIFENNIGFFWRNIYQNKGNTYGILTNRKSFENYIPWQLVLSNPLWKEPDMFELILNALNKKYNNSHYYFRIQDYIEIPGDLSCKMAKYLPKGKLFDSHKVFIKNNPGLFINNIEIANKFKDQINDNQYSPFYYLYYPLDMQVDFIKKSTRSYQSKFDLVKKMSISKDEKIKLLSEISKIHLDV